MKLIVMSPSSSSVLSLAPVPTAWLAVMLNRSRRRTEGQRRIGVAAGPRPVVVAVRGDQAGYVCGGSVRPADVEPIAILVRREVDIVDPDRDVADRLGEGEGGPDHPGVRGDAGGARREDAADDQAAPSAVPLIKASMAGIWTLLMTVELRPLIAKLMVKFRVAPSGLRRRVIVAVGVVERRRGLTAEIVGVSVGRAARRRGGLGAKSEAD